MNICEGDMLRIFKFVGEILNIFKFFIPLVIIIYGSFDFGKSVISNKTDDIKKMTVVFIKRIVSGILIFFLPAIIELIFDVINQPATNCFKCVVNTKKCNITEKENNNSTSNQRNNILNNSYCSKYNNKNDCNNDTVCKWENIENFKVNFSTNEKYYCINTYFTQ